MRTVPGTPSAYPARSETGRAESDARTAALRIFSKLLTAGFEVKPACTNSWTTTAPTASLRLRRSPGTVDTTIGNDLIWRDEPSRRDDIKSRDIPCACRCEASLAPMRGRWARFSERTARCV
jgi:hypothetical protein